MQYQICITFFFFFKTDSLVLMILIIFLILLNPFSKAHKPYERIWYFIEKFFKKFLIEKIFICCSISKYRPNFFIKKKLFIYIDFHCLNNIFLFMQMLRFIVVWHEVRLLKFLDLLLQKNNLLHTFKILIQHCLYYILIQHCHVLACRISLYVFYYKVFLEIFMFRWHRHIIYIF